MKRFRISPLLLAAVLTFPAVLYGELKDKKMAKKLAVTEEIPWILTPERVDTIPSLKAEELIQIPLNGKWLMVPGKPKTGWALQKQPGKAFQLELNCVDFKKVASEEEYRNGEAVLYYEFESPKEGIAQLGMACDWNFEARCNGILCWSTMKYGNQTGHYGPQNHPFFFPVKKGKNLLAVHTKRGSIGWTFFCGAIPFAMPTLPKLWNPPTLMWPDRDTMSVGFLTWGKIGAGIEYRGQNEKAWKTVWDHRCGQIVRREFHTVTMTGLKPGREYVYRAVLIDRDDPKIRVRSPEYTFRMPAADTGKFSFFFTADLQYPYAEQQKLLRDLLKYADAESCDFIVLGGDIGGEFDPEHVVRDLFPLLPAQKPLVYLRGNHELRGDDTSSYYDYFAMPNGRTYGLFRFGDTAFMVLDSWEDKPAATGGAHLYCKYNLDSWFHQTEIREVKPLFRSKAWTSAGKRIVLCHSAPYSHAGEMIPDFLKKIVDDDLKGATPKSRLNLWVTGHKHFHMRSVPGTNEIAAAGEPDAPACGGTNYAFPVITVAGPTKRSKIKASAYRVDGSEKGIRVRSYADSGVLLEDLFYDNDGKLSAAKELKRYTVKPLHAE